MIGLVPRGAEVGISGPTPGFRRGVGEVVSSRRRPSVLSASPATLGFARVIGRAGRRDNWTPFRPALFLLAAWASALLSLHLSTSWKPLARQSLRLRSPRPAGALGGTAGAGHGPRDPLISEEER